MSDRVVNTNLSEFKSTLYKEADFDSINFPKQLVNMYKCIYDPTYNVKEGIPAPPSIGEILGVYTSSFSEKPSYLTDECYYYPLDNDLDGSIGKDYMGSNGDYLGISKKTPVRNIDQVIPIGKGIGNPLIDYFGAHTEDSTYANLITPQKEIKQYWNIQGQPMDINIVGDPKGIVLNPENQKDILFSMPFTITEKGNYCVSINARIENSSYKNLTSNEYTYLYGVCLESNKAVDFNLSDFTPYEIIAPAGCDKSIVKGQNQYKFKVITEWNPIATVTTLNPGDYKLIIYWPTSSPRNTNLKIAGLSIRKASNYWHFDYRDIKSVTAPGTKFPLLFNFNKVSLNEQMTSKSFVISYKRKVMGSSLENFKTEDSLGNLTWGFKNGNLYLGTVNKAINNYDPFNHWETIILVYNKSTIKLYYASDSYVIDGPEISASGYDFNSTLNIQGETPVKFNLGLGSSLKNGVLNITPGAYKDLIYFPIDSNKEIDVIKKHLSNDFFAVGRTQNINVKNPTERIVLRASNFMEGATN